MWFKRPIEWPTLALLAATYVVWLAAIFWVAQFSIILAIILVTLSAAQHSSLQHEVIHGHPTASQRLNEALVFPSLAIFIPYIRFRDTHLMHHQDSNLTDPYDDPESNYVCPNVWEKLPRSLRRVLNINNSLAGRIVIGPLVAQVAFMACDWRLIRDGDRSVLRAWLWHIPAAGIVIWLMLQSAMPVWAWVLATYGAISVLKIRTYLEHQAHEKARGRTVIVEDRGLLSLLFLNNNFHVVHHMHPRVPWYQLPKLFAENRDRYLTRNDGYYYRNYREIFGRYLFRSKDQVPHPLWRR